MSVRLWLRRLLGTDGLPLALHRIANHLNHLEELVATGTEQITALSAKVDGLITDVRAALAVINNDQLSDAAQAALDDSSAKVAAFDTEVEGDVPAPTPTPTPEPAPAPDDPTNA